MMTPMPIDVNNMTLMENFTAFASPRPSSFETRTLRTDETMKLVKDHEGHIQEIDGKGMRTRELHRATEEPEAHHEFP